jgi:outer membrane protein TolC
VSLNLTRYLYRESFPDDVDWTGLIIVDLPIFSAGLVNADVRTAYSRLRQANLAESGPRRTVIRELRVAATGYDSRCTGSAVKPGAGSAQARRMATN